MLYIIEILEKRSTESPYQIVTSEDGLFNIAFILENVDRVSQFKVSSSNTILEAKQFGFGEFSKWVFRFDYKKADE
jgi:hypothetical protein